MKKTSEMPAPEAGRKTLAARAPEFGGKNSIPSFFGASEETINNY